GTLRLHTWRTDSHRDLSEARRLRGQESWTARDDRRARRVLRPCRHHGFAHRAASWLVQLGSDALARVDPCRHDPDVEAACSALADRRHLRVRGRPAAAGVGTRHGGDFRTGDEPRQGPEAARSERRIYEAGDDWT